MSQKCIKENKTIMIYTSQIHGHYCKRFQLVDVGF